MRKGGRPIEACYPGIDTSAHHCLLSASRISNSELLIQHAISCIFFLLLELLELFRKVLKRGDPFKTDHLNHKTQVTRPWCMRPWLCVARTKCLVGSLLHLPSLVSYLMHQFTTGAPWCAQHGAPLFPTIVHQRTIPPDPCIYPGLM